jgi:hypothetical protein
MNLFKKSNIIVAGLLLACVSTTSAHIGYTGRDFGTFAGNGSDTSKLIASNTVVGNYGWASGTDANLGDSHKTRAFKFTLLSTGLVTLEIQGLDIIKSGAPVSALANPGFSIFAGLAATSSHDFSTASTAYNNATYGTNGDWPTILEGSNYKPQPGAPKWEGSFNAVENWAVGVDGAAVNSPLSYFTYVANAADGIAAQYNANGGTGSGINWDGNADGHLRASFVLDAGDYSIFIGGADYFGTSNAGADITGSYAFNATLSVAAIPEPSTYALIALSATFLIVACRRRTPKGQSAF